MSAKSIEELNWNNSDNNTFYESLKVEGLKAFAEKAGLASGCDMDALEPYWSKAKSILEVGAGYGRVIDYLMEHQFQGTITAIERCETLFNYLNKIFHEYQKIYLLHKNIHHLNNVNKKFDLILYMWSGIADFSKTEQPIIITKLATLLKKNGKLVIDTIPINIMPLGVTKLGKQFYSLKSNNVIKYIYEPSSNEIEQYAKEAGFSNFSRITCRTDIGRERWLHILS